MSDLISRKILIDEVYQMNGNRYVKETIVNVIREQPTIQQEQAEPAEAERINTAREMIEAEIAGAEKGGWRELNYLDGLRFALDCLDKPAEPMVSVESVKNWIINCDWFNEGKIFTNQFDEWIKWLDKQETK